MTRAHVWQLTNWSLAAFACVGIRAMSAEAKDWPRSVAGKHISSVAAMTNGEWPALTSTFPSRVRKAAAMGAVKENWLARAWRV